MSKRRQAGEVVKKSPNVGFVKESLTIRLLDDDEPAWPCILCDDPDCREWSNAEVIEDGKVSGSVFHISECEMEDIE